METDPPDPDWFLREWLAHFGKRQSSLVNELGWDKARANFLFHSKQAYRRDDVNTISSWLGIAPHELLMRPEDALALRLLRRTAAQIAAGGYPIAAEAGGGSDIMTPAGRAKGRKSK